MNQDNNTCDPSHSINKIMHDADATRPDTTAFPSSAFPHLHQLNGNVQPLEMASASSENPAPLPANGSQNWNTEAFGPVPAVPAARADLTPQLVPPIDQQILQARLILAGLQMNPNQTIQNPLGTVKSFVTEKIQLLELLQEGQWNFEVSEQQRHDAFRDIGRLLLIIEQMKKDSEDANVQKEGELEKLKEEKEKKEIQFAELSAALKDRREADEVFEKERHNWEEEKKQMNEEKANLIKNQANLLSEEKLRHVEEMTEMKEKHKQAEIRHGAEIEQLKNEAARDLKAVLQKLEKETARNLEKKIQEQSVLVAQFYAEELSESENRHQNQLEEMRKKIDESARLQKEQEEQHKEKEAKHMDEQANLQNKIDDLIVKQQVFRTVMTEAAKMLYRSGDTRFAPEALKGSIKQDKNDITEQIRKTTDSGRKRAADFLEASPIAKKKIDMNVNEDSD